MKKQALDMGLLSETASPLLRAALGLVLIGPPTFAGYLGYQNSKMKSKLEKDKEFEVQKRMAQALDEAIETTK